MSDTNGIAGFAAFLIGSLVDDPSAVRIDASPGTASVILELHVGAGQAGQVIGRHGRNLEAVRTRLSAYGAKDGRRVFVELVEPTPPAEAHRATTAQYDGGRSAPARAGRSVEKLS